MVGVWGSPGGLLACLFLYLMLVLPVHQDGRDVNSQRVAYQSLYLYSHINIIIVIVIIIIVIVSSTDLATEVGIPG